MSSFQMERLDSVEIEAIARRHLAACCNELCAKLHCAPANAVAIMMKECADGLGEIDEPLTRRFLRILHEGYSAKIDGDRRANVRKMAQLALVIQELVLLEIQKFAKPEQTQ